MNGESKRIRPGSGIQRQGSGVRRPGSGVGPPKPASGVVPPKPASTVRPPNPGSGVRPAGSGSSSSSKLGSSSSGKISSSSSGKISSSSSGKMSSSSSGKLGSSGSGISRPSSKIGNPPSSRILRGQQADEAPERPATGGMRKSNIKAGGKTSTAKIFGLAAVGIAALIGIILWVQSRQPDSKKIQEEHMATYKALLAKYPNEDQIVQLDEALQPMLEEPLFIKYGGAVYKTIKTQADKAHQSAEQEKKALPEVKPALDKWNALKGELDDKHKEQAQALYDQLRGLYNKYSSSLNGPKINEAVIALRAFLESSSGPGIGKEYLDFRNNFDKLVGQNEFTQAKKLADDFKTGHANLDSVMAKEVDERLEKINRTSVTYVEKLLKEAEKLKKDEKLPEAKKLVDEAIPKLEGFDAQAKLKAFK